MRFAEVMETTEGSVSVQMGRLERNSLLVCIHFR